MKCCWHGNPNKRPSMREVAMKLAAMIDRNGGDSV
jgi:hypothetical protein